MKYRNEYDRIMKTKTPEVAIEILSMICQVKDKQIEELKEMIRVKEAKKELEV